MEGLIGKGHMPESYRLPVTCALFRDPSAGLYGRLGTGFRCPTPKYTHLGVTGNQRI